MLIAEDIPGSKIFGPLIPDQPSLAVDMVRHLGEPVALVIAENSRAAEAGLAAIEVSYEPLAPVFDPETALSEDASDLHIEGNLVSELDIGTGNIQTGFQEADLILEDTFEVPRIHPGYMEPETSLAIWEEDQTVTVWVSSQHPFTDQSFIADALQLPVERVRVKSAYVGGGFWRERGFQFGDPGSIERLGDQGLCSTGEYSQGIFPGASQTPSCTDPLQTGR